MIGIYKITSPVGKIYIGKARNIKKRWWCYKRLQKNSIGRKLYNSLKKYGPDQHSYEVIEIFGNDVSALDISLRETFHWKFFFEHGFKMLNSVPPAVNPIIKTQKPITQETKDKIRAKLIGRKHSEERRRNIEEGVRINNPNGLVAWNKGKTNYISEETRNKIKVARARQVFSLESRIKKGKAISLSKGYKISYNGQVLSLKRICDLEKTPYKPAQFRYKNIDNNIYNIVTFYKRKLVNEES